MTSGRCNQSSSRGVPALIYAMVILLLMTVALMPRIARAQSVGEICSNEPVPQGFAVTAALINLSQCVGGTGYRIEVPHDGIYICVGSPVPSDYAVTYVDPDTTTCRGSKRWRINTPYEGITACAGTALPAGWVFTEIQNSTSGCEGAHRLVLETPMDGLQICLTSPFPSGYVVTGKPSASRCLSESRGLVIRRPYDGVRVCVTSPVSVGYVIPGTHPSSQCGGEDAHELRIPYDGIVVCGYSPIPSGWQASETAGVSWCGSATFGPILRPLGLPTADFLVAINGLTAVFTDRSSDNGAIVSHSWSFGDGAQSSDVNPSHAFATGGYYSTTLTVVDDDGHSNSKTKSIYVAYPAPGDPQPPTASVVVGRTFKLTWQSSPGGARYVLEQSMDGGVWGIVYDGSGTSWTATDMEPSTYAFRLKACSVDACSDYSAPVSFTVAADLSPVVWYLLN